jgi:sigma-B regulation protein RsbU (phosphoserine phosphatase)
MNWLESPAFDSLAVKLKPGETLIIYSDGVTEAQNEMDQFFGAPTLLHLSEALCKKPAQEIHDAMVEAVKDFTGRREPADDVTLVVIKAN